MAQKPTDTGQLVDAEAAVGNVKAEPQLLELHRRALPWKYGLENGFLRDEAQLGMIDTELRELCLLWSFVRSTHARSQARIERRIVFRGRRPRPQSGLRARPPLAASTRSQRSQWPGA